MSAGIGAFPTFQFFINGNKVDEMKGANPQALENKVLEHKSKAGGAAFSGQGSTLGGGAPAWDGVGMPPGSNDRAARLAKFGHIDTKKKTEDGSAGVANESVAAPAPVVGGEEDGEEDEDSAIAKAIALSMSSLGQEEAAGEDSGEKGEANEGDDDMVPVPVNSSHLSLVSSSSLHMVWGVTWEVPGPIARGVLLCGEALSHPGHAM